MKKYESYKSTKIEFLDAIPEHWEEKRLRFLGYLYGGLTGKSAKDFNQPDNDDNKYFIPFTNIAGNLKINPDQLQHVVIEEDEKQNEVKVGDLFFLMSSEDYDDVGRSAVLTEELTETYLNSFCKGLRLTSSEIYPEYLNYHLHSKQLRHNLLIEANGFTRINLKVGKVQDLYVAFPNKPEQTAIATYLDRKTTEIDELIADKKRLLELYEEEKTAIINQAVTKGINVDAPMKDSGIEWLGVIPEHWEVKKIKHLVSKTGSGVTPSGGASVYKLCGIPLLRSQNIHFGGLRLDDVAYITEEIHESMKNSQVCEGDVLLNITGASIGRAYFVESWLGEANVNQHVCILRPNSETDTRFLYFILRSNVGQEQIRIEQTGSGREGLNFEALKNFILPFLPIEEQRTIAEYLEAKCNHIKLQMERTQKLIELLKEYREALISEVVTGQIKVID